LETGSTTADGADQLEQLADGRRLALPYPRSRTMDL